MYNIIQLNDKDLSELQSIAKELGIKKTDSLKKEDLVYKILDEQAIVGATQKVAAEKANESQPRKRSRINVKKDGDKVYTATKDKAQKLEANTPQPAAAAAETVKETAPVAVTPQTEAVAETSAEEKTPKKRGRKPGSKKVTAKTRAASHPAKPPPIIKTSLYIVLLGKIFLTAVFICAYKVLFSFVNSLYHIRTASGALFVRHLIR